MFYLTSVHASVAYCVTGSSFKSECSQKHACHVEWPTQTRCSFISISTCTAGITDFTPASGRANPCGSPLLPAQTLPTKGLTTRLKAVSYGICFSLNAITGISFLESDLRGFAIWFDSFYFRFSSAMITGSLSQFPNITNHAIRCYSSISR